MENPTAFPKMPEPGGRSHALEASASMVWTLLFLAYSSSTFISEFGTGWTASWTILLVILPVTLAGTPAILDGRRGSVGILLSYILYVLIPSVLQLLKPADYTSITSELVDFFTVSIIWLPLELKLLSKDLSPTGTVTAWGLLTAALNIVNIFTVLRPLSELSHAREIGYSFKMSPIEILYAVFLSLAFIGLAIPLATSTRLGKFKLPGILKVEREIPTLIGLYMSGIAEELLFRGLIQNMLEQRLGRSSPLALSIAALIYGGVHIRKAKLGIEAPNYRYALVATLAGFTCGLAWRWTGKICASAITHATGDYLLWNIFLKQTNEA